MVDKFRDAPPAWVDEDEGHPVGSRWLEVTVERGGHAFTLRVQPDADEWVAAEGVFLAGDEAPTVVRVEECVVMAGPGSVGESR